VKPVFFVISSLDYSGAARQLTLLASGLGREGLSVRVCVLGGPSAWGDEQSAAGVAVSILGPSRPFDLLPFVALRRLLRSFSGVVHVWGPAALRAAALIVGLRRLWVSAALPPVGKPGRIDAWMLRRVGRVVAFGETDAARYRDAEVAAERITVVTPGVKLPADSVAGAEARRSPGGLPGLRSTSAPATRIVILGPLLPHKGVRDAVWAMDILHYLHHDLQLVLVGHVPPTRELVGLSHVAGVHFVGPSADVMPYLQQADLVWIPGRAGGVSAALEAMAASKPVVAGRSPELAEVIDEGVTGVFFQPGDKADLARHTRRLLDDEDRRRTLGEAGRVRVAERFAPAQLCARYAALLNGAGDIRACTGVAVWT
jgi:glycosyltransferase involved in cell wall biosynthesis